MQKAITSILLIILFSCQKTNLNDDKAILAGKWKWIYSVQQRYQYYDITSPPTIDTIWPFEVNHSYSLEMLERGKMKFIEDGKGKKHRLIISGYHYNSVNNSYAGQINFGDYNNNFALLDRNIDSLRIENVFPNHRVEEAPDYIYQFSSVLILLKDTQLITVLFFEIL